MRKTQRKKDIIMPPKFHIRLLFALVLLAITSSTGLRIGFGQAPNDKAKDTAPVDASPKPPRFSISQTHIKKSGIQTAKPVYENFSLEISLSGHVSLNEDKLAHISPIVNGQVESVKVGLGDVVKEGDLLVSVHSREVGTAKLDLFQAKSAFELASLKLKLQEDLTGNTRALLVALREQREITEIQKEFSGRSMGDYRERLLQAYSNYIKSQADVERLSSVAASGAVASKQLTWAKSSRNADLATFLARIEQVEYELKTSILQASQTVKESETRVAVSKANLSIMGCREEDISDIDPVHQKQAISDYMIRAPFQGTIISKDVVLGEQLRPDTQIMTIADLSTVWIEADIYEKDIPLLAGLKDRTLKVRNAIWPNRDFEATIFYTGEIMDEKTRTISLRAVAQNKNNLLKPGMFVKIEFASSAGNQPVLQVPNDAIMEHEGKQFIFISLGDGQFDRRDIVAGPRNASMTVIEKGILESDTVVTAGGFVLKSKMLEGLLGEE